jgi:hypothetical protein
MEIWICSRYSSVDLERNATNVVVGGSNPSTESLERLTLVCVAALNTVGANTT